ncbi:MAG TPA: hypothetical protein VFP91_16995 [Vicinamibacterales bacterium]|nr:hypothetical protein [Vicinamibacterales bacterium]
MHTAIRRLLWALVLLPATGRMASAKDVRVDVVFDGPLSRTLEDRALKEATLIWATYGVDVSASDSHGCESADAVRLTVTFANGRNQGVAAASLGSIRFHDGVPEPAIVLYPVVIGALVSATPYGSFMVDSPGALRDLVLGRVLGRALAHEIGHFLLRSQEHSTGGLMRASQPTAALMDPDRHRFELSAGDVRRLAVVRSSSPQRAGALSCID